jgi:hypothetical protein
MIIEDLVVETLHFKLRVEPELKGGSFPYEINRLRIKCGEPDEGNISMPVQQSPENLQMNRKSHCCVTVLREINPAKIRMPKKNSARTKERWFIEHPNPV